MDDPEIAPKIAAYMQQIEKNFQELTFKEPIKIPDVF
jgi:hypothetical protein